MPPFLLAEVHLVRAMAWLHVQPDLDEHVSSAEDILRFVRTSDHIPEGINELGQALNIMPDYLPAHQYLAIIYRSQGNEQMAHFHER
jgi:hypothetical protein